MQQAQPDFSQVEEDTYRHMTPYLRSVFKSTFSQKAISGRFLQQQKKNSSGEDEDMKEDDDFTKDILLLTQEELVLHPAPCFGNHTEDIKKLQRFPLS